MIDWKVAEEMVTEGPIAEVTWVERSADKKMVVEMTVAEDTVNKKVELDLLVVKWWSGVEELLKGWCSDNLLFFVSVV